MKVERIEFLDLLRGVSALVVMLSHYIHGFPILNGFLFNSEKTINLWTLLSAIKIDGSFGVALFFLVSGFVISKSIESHTLISFLIQRIFRIYPTYIICSILLFIFSISIGTSNINSWLSALLTTTLFRDWIGVNPFDSISWTLEIEVKYYLYCIIIAMAVKTYFHSPMLSTSIYNNCRAREEKRAFYLYLSATSKHYNHNCNLFWIHSTIPNIRSCHFIRKRWQPNPNNKYHCI